MKKRILRSLLSIVLIMISYYSSVAQCTGTWLSVKSAVGGGASTVEANYVCNDPTLPLHIKGIVDYAALGGSPSSFSWSSGESSQDITTYTPGTYTLTAQASTGCATASIVIAQGSPPPISVTVTPPSPVPANSTVSVTVSATFGSDWGHVQSSIDGYQDHEIMTANASYTWTNVQIGSGAFTFAYQAHDDVGCGANGSYTIDIASCSAPTPSGTGGSACSGETVSLSGSGCTSGYTLKWFSDSGLSSEVGSGNNFTTPTLSSTTNYYISCVSDADATCKSSAVTVTATINDAPSLSAGTPTCDASGTTYHVSVTSNGTLSTTAGTVSGSSIINIPAGTDITITSTLNGCTSTTGVTSPTCSLPCTPPTPSGTGGSACSGETVNLSGSGCTSGFTLTWYSNSGLSSELGTGTSFTTPTLSSTTTYYISCVSDADASCKSSGVSVIATINQAPSLSVSSTTCNGAATQYSVTVSSTTGATITADFGTVSGNTISGIPSGQVVTITATLNGCSTTTTTVKSCVANCDISASLGTITCVGGTTTTDVSDDAFTFDVTVTGTPGASNLWEAVYNGNVIQTGAYGDTKTITTSSTASSMTVIIRDKDNPSCFTSVSVTVPSCSPAPCTGFEFINYVASCENGLHKICFDVIGTNGRPWVASLKKSSDFTVAGIQIATGTGNQSGVCATISAADFTTLEAFSPSNFILWGMLETSTGGPIYGTGCEIDYTVPYSACPPTCTLPTVGTPVVTQATCNAAGTAANNDASISITGITNATVYAYTTDGSTPAFAGATAVSGGAINLTGLANPVAATTYKFRVFNGSATCYTDVTATLNPKTCTPTCITPVAKGYGTPATCSGGTPNNDAKIELYAISNATKYGYSLGTSYTGVNYSAATNISGVTASITGLTSSGGNTTYTIRVFNGSDACFDDIQVIVPFSDCMTNCTIDAGEDKLICQPTTTVDFADALATQEWIVGTLNPGGATINASTGVVSGMTTNGIYSFILREKATPTCMDEVYVFKGVVELPFMTSCDATYQLPTIAGVTWTSVSGGASVTAAGLISGMNTNGSYSFSAIFGACNTTVIVEKITCACVAPNAGADVTICLPKTTLNLTDAIAGTEWMAVAGNPAAAIINASTGVITGMTAAGTYKFRLQKTGDATCFDEMQVIVTAGSTAIALCNDGSTSYTLVAQSGITNVIWYNMAGVQVGTGTNLVVKSTTLGLEDGTEAYYYVGTSTTGSTSGCDVELCCPVKFITQSCCPTPNCLSVSVIKN